MQQKTVVYICSVIFIVVLVWIVMAEMDRRQGEMVPPVSSYYRGQVLLAPYSFWMSHRGQLTESPVLPASRLPETELLRNNWEVIRDEALQLYNNGLATTIEHDMFFQEIAPKGTWKKFYLRWYSDKIGERERQLCPQTCTLLDQLPTLHLAMFSILEPGARIKPHRGPFKGALRYHLALSTPNSDECAINVDGTQYSWRDGEDVLFDDSFLHEVRCEGDKPRIILFADFERPMRTKLEQKLNRFVCKTIAPLTTRANDKTEAQSKEIGSAIQRDVIEQGSTSTIK